MITNNEHLGKLFLQLGRDALFLCQKKSYCYDRTKEAVNNESDRS